MRSFVKIKPSLKSEIILLFTDEGKSWPSLEFLKSHMSFNAIRENFRIYSIPATIETLHKACLDIILFYT